MRNIAKQFLRLFIPYKNNGYKPHILRPKNLFWLAVVLLAIKFLVFSFIYYFPKTANFADVTTSELVALANKDREEAGLKPLSTNQQLVAAAQKKAIDMLNKDYFSHNSPSGLTPWYWLDKVGYKYSAAGENLAKDFTESEYVNDAWMNSPSHRANILNKSYSDVGIAVVEGTIGGKKTILAVQFFGKSAIKTSATAIKTSANAVKTLVIGEIATTQPKTETSQNVKGEAIDSLKGPQVFKERGIITGLTEETKNIVATIAEKSEPLTQKIYIVVLGVIALILMLSAFLNLKAHHPKVILMVLVFIILIAVVASFNGGAILNKGIDIL